MSVEVLPGWELVRIGKPVANVDWIIGSGGLPELFSWATDSYNWPIIRKIEKPKKFRPFANAAEFRPHRERWMTHPENTVVGEFQVVEFNDIGIWCNGMKKLMPYKTAFEIGLRFDDGTPFGIEVTE